jgi:hypothetical protein
MPGAYWPNGRAGDNYAALWSGGPAMALTGAPTVCAVASKRSARDAALLAAPPDTWRVQRANSAPFIKENDHA